MWFLPSYLMSCFLASSVTGMSDATLKGEVNFFNFASYTMINLSFSIDRLSGLPQRTNIKRNTRLLPIDFFWPEKSTLEQSSGSLVPRWDWKDRQSFYIGNFWIRKENQKYVRFSFLLSWHRISFMLRQFLIARALVAFNFTGKTYNPVSSPVQWLLYLKLKRSQIFNFHVDRTFALGLKTVWKWSQNKTVLKFPLWAKKNALHLHWKFTTLTP